jgi:hypothetical protein
MAPKGKKGASDDSRGPPSQRSWKEKLGKAFGTGKNSSTGT